MFNLTLSIARGQVKRLRDEKGKEYRVTPQQRIEWGRLATRTGEAMHNIAEGFDEKRFQTDLKQLQQMLDEIQRKEARK